MSKHIQGFTIIEVVLVLAIAGLIFLMVFVALPALQRSQRDTQRRNDMSRLASALTQYQANNGGLPGGQHSHRCEPETGTGKAGNIKPNTANTYDSNVACSFIAQYLNQAGSDSNNFKDPNGTAYGLYIYPAIIFNDLPWQDNEIYVVKNAKCEGENFESYSGNSKYAILYKLEGFGTICIDNQ